MPIALLKLQISDVRHLNAYISVNKAGTFFLFFFEDSEREKPGLPQMLCEQPTEEIFQPE